MRYLLLVLILLVGCNESNKQNKVGASSVAQVARAGSFFIYGYGAVTDDYGGIARQKAFQMAQVYSRISQFAYSPGGNISLKLRKKAGAVMNNSGQEFPISEKSVFRTHVVQFMMHPKIYDALPTNPHNPAFKKDFSFGINNAPRPAEVFNQTIEAYVTLLGALERTVEGDIFFSHMIVNDSTRVTLTASIF